MTRDGGTWRAVFESMGSPCELLVEHESEAMARRIAYLARDEAGRIDRLYSRYRPDSIVTMLNASNGSRRRVDDETAKLLEYGAALWRMSEGRFDLTSGVLREAWSFDEGPVHADPSRIEALMARVGWQRVTWDAPWLTLPAGMEIDLGGIGKEYAVDRVADIAAGLTDAPVLVNFGGDLRCVGGKPAGGAWRIGVESVEQAGAAVKLVELSAGALATSGDAKRHVEIDGVRYGHIFDARTGWPPPGAPRSVTVAADTCTQAGSYSTLAMLQGEGAEAFLEAEGVRYWVLR
ncbi:MAG TPA: FAD:protein FMN transferase [Steroidobacteraceae bacterium]|nr:FAD:protein FMN transferase [Steroidobacteraceae bacterium]